MRAARPDSYHYQCAKTEIVNNPNWFAVADFITLLRENDKIPPADT